VAPISPAAVSQPPSPGPGSASETPRAAPSCKGEPWQVHLYRRSIKKRETLRAAERLLPPLAGLRCLEIECGNGIANWILRRCGGAWVCLDSVAEQVDSARRLLDDEVHHVEGDQLPFPDASFDVIVGPSRRLGYRLRKAYGFTADRLGAYGDIRDGYHRDEVVGILGRAGLDVERYGTYARIFTEALENTLLYLYYRSMRAKPGIAERYPAGTWSVSEETLEPAGWRFRLYAAFHPLLRGLSLLDRVVPFLPGYMFGLRARKPER
jgi:SAM-dependent methyltransferase